MRFKWRCALILVAAFFIVENSSLLASGGTSIIEDDSIVRHFCDGLAEDIVRGDVKVIRSKMSSDIREAYSEGQFNELYRQIIATNGQLKKYEFKMGQTGIKKYGSGLTLPMKKLWYAVTTSKHKKGEYFLFIEVIVDGSHMASSGFSVVTFPGGPPPELK